MDAVAEVKEFEYTLNAAERKRLLKDSLAYVDLLVDTVGEKRVSAELTKLQADLAQSVHNGCPTRSKDCDPVPNGDYPGCTRCAQCGLLRFWSQHEGRFV